MGGIEGADSRKNKHMTTSLERKVNEIVSGHELNGIMDLFRTVNPTHYTFFGNKGQRAALQRLIRNFGSEKVRKMIEVISQTNGKMFAPIITTPYELEKNLGKLVAFVKKEQEKEKRDLEQAEKQSHIGKWKCALGNWHDKKYNDCSC